MLYYLYKKTHRDTGLKYLGYTKLPNPYEYQGSGKYWTRHIQKHGYNIDTEILFETTDKNKIKEKGLYYSNLWNVVKSDEWANLKPESGNGGTFTHREDSIEKIRDYQFNKVWTKKALDNLKAIGLKSAAKRKGSKWTTEHRQSRMTAYVAKNLEIATKIIELADCGYNKLTIAKKLNVSWDKVKYSLLNRAEFEAKLKETQNY
jgi:hypothetical protein